MERDSCNPPCCMPNVCEVCTRSRPSWHACDALDELAHRRCACSSWRRLPLHVSVARPLQTSTPQMLLRRVACASARPLAAQARGMAIAVGSKFPSVEVCLRACALTLSSLLLIGLGKHMCRMRVGRSTLLRGRRPHSTLPIASPRKRLLWSGSPAPLLPPDPRIRCLASRRHGMRVRSSWHRTHDLRNAIYCSRRRRRRRG